MSEALRYPSKIFFSEDDGGFIAIAPDLPGCSAFGDTAEAALRELQDAIQAWIGAAKKAGNPVPPPSREQVDELPSGRVLLRLPKTLHAQLIERANSDGTSLNTCLVMLLSHSFVAPPRSYAAADRLHLHALKVIGVSSTSEQALRLSWSERIASSRTLWFTRIAEPTETGKRLVQGGSVMNVRTLPANKPVLYRDDENG